jgi:UPF0176 protein
MQLHNKVNREELRKQMIESNEERITLSFYKYWHIDEPKIFRNDLYKAWTELGVFGRVYVSYEGINAQISLPTTNKAAFTDHLYSISALNGLRLNWAVEDDGKSFFKLTIKVREKIVADGLDDTSFDVTNIGTHVKAAQFNELANNPNTIIVDMRNHYESEVGHFENAVTPQVETFREELPLVEEMFQDQKDKNLLLYCTGGIRCEKASAYFKHKGFENVFQLEGGIINYARQVEEQGLENKFIGKNFVFDERLGERITEDVISECHQCGKPCDTHVNCANDACHLLFIQCDECAEKYESCCSNKCQDFNKLPEEQRKALRPRMEFNGTHFSKNTKSKNVLMLELEEMNVEFQTVEKVIANDRMNK